MNLKCSGMILIYPGMNLIYSGMILKYSGMNLKCSRMNLKYSGMIPKYPGMIPKYPVMILNHPVMILNHPVVILNHPVVYLNHPVMIRKYAGAIWKCEARFLNGFFARRNPPGGFSSFSKNASGRRRSIRLAVLLLCPSRLFQTHFRGFLKIVAGVFIVQVNACEAAIEVG